MTRRSNPVNVPASRLARMGQLGATTAGIAGRVALGGVGAFAKGQRPDMQSLLLTPTNLQRITARLAQMRGAAMKVGQLVSMDSGELLPPELAQIMARLREDSDFMPPAQLKRVLNAEWPKGWLSAFQHFDVRPIAAASIGQVHRVTLKDGRTLAVKVQYPGVADSIDSDVANVGALIKLSGLLPKGFDLAPYLEEGRKQLHEETDYLREGRDLTLFSKLLAQDARFAVPSFHEDWSTNAILAMDFMNGTPIEDVGDLPQDQRDGIITSLVDLTLRELFSFGVMQTDPNFANYRFDRDTGRIVLLDFGATQRIGKTAAQHYRALFEAGLAGDRQGVCIAAADLGFIAADTKERHANAVIDMIQYSFDILTKTQPFNFSDGQFSDEMQKRGMALANDGFIPPALPIEVLLVQRKLGGVFLLGNRLGARVDLMPLITAHLQGNCTGQAQEGA